MKHSAWHIVNTIIVTHYNVWSPLPRMYYLNSTLQSTFHYSHITGGETEDLSERLKNWPDFNHGPV